MEISTSELKKFLAVGRPQLIERIKKKATSALYNLEDSFLSLDVDYNLIGECSPVLLGLWLYDSFIVSYSDNKPEICSDWDMIPITVLIWVDEMLDGKEYSIKEYIFDNE